MELFSESKSVPALEELVDELNVKIDARDEKYAVAMYDELKTGRNGMMSSRLAETV